MTVYKGKDNGDRTYPCRECGKPAKAWGICQKCLRASRRDKNTLASAPDAVAALVKGVESGVRTDYPEGMTAEELPIITGTGHITIKRPKPKPEAEG